MGKRRKFILCRPHSEMPHGLFDAEDVLAHDFPRLEARQSYGLLTNGRFHSTPPWDEIPSGDARTYPSRDKHLDAIARMGSKMLVPEKGWNVQGVAGEQLYC
jgi:hypothetical protein